MIRSYNLALTSLESTRTGAYHRGCAVQGRLTLLLGPPSCGKSTFLKALAARLPRTQSSGSVLYNGIPADEFCAPRSCAFVPQADNHVANLTAAETVRFAYDMQDDSKGAHAFADGCAYCQNALSPCVALAGAPGGAPWQVCEHPAKQSLGL